MQRFVPSAVGLIALVRAVSVTAAEPECPFLDDAPGAEPLRVDLSAGSAELFGQYAGQLFAFGATAGCAGCEVTASGSVYDPCRNEWEIQRLSLGKGFRMDDGAIKRFGDRVVGLTLAVRRNPALDPESDYTLLQSDTRGVIFDLRRRKLAAIPRHEREWSSGQDVIDGFADANDRYVVYLQKPRGRGARVFVYDVARGRWAGYFNAPQDLGRLLTTSGAELWFERNASAANGARYLVFSPTKGSTRTVRGAPPDAGATPPDPAALEVRNRRGRWSGSLTMPIERADQRYELRIGVRTTPGPNGCENVTRRPCDPFVSPPITRLDAVIQRLTAPPAAKSPAVPPSPNTAPLPPSKRPATSVTSPVVAAGGRVFASSLVRAGDAWALAYYRARNSVDSDLYLVRFDDDARVLSDTPLGPGIPATLAWSGDTLGIAYSVFENGEYVAYFARADKEGALIEGSRVRLTQSPCYAPRVVWNGERQEWGVAWHGTRETPRRVRLTRIAGSGVVLGTHELAATAGLGGAAALASAGGHYHLLLSPTLRWVEHDGERVVASVELSAQSYDPNLVVDGEALLASWVEGSKAIVARIEGGEVRSKKTLFDVGEGRHIQGLVLAPRSAGTMAFWGEHSSAVYNTAIFAARATLEGTTAPVALDPTPEPQGFPFVATSQHLLMLVYQRGDYNGAPRLVARPLSHELSERVLGEQQKKSLGEMLRDPPPFGRLPLGTPMPCNTASPCGEKDRRPAQPK